MRILFIAPQPFFVIRGTPIAIKHLLGVLSRLGHQVDLITFPQGEDIVLPGLSIYRVKGLSKKRHIKAGISWEKIWLDIPLFFNAFLKLIKNKYDVVHGVEEAAFMSAIFHQIFKISFVFDMDSDIPHQLEYSKSITNPFVLKICRAIESWSLRKAKIVLTVCQSLSDHVKEISKEIEIHQIEDPPVQSEVNHTQFNEWDLSKKVILYTGNFESYQGVEFLIQSFNEVYLKYPNSLLILVGGIQADLRELEDHLIDHPAVKFMGSQPIDKMDTYMYYASVLVSPRLVGVNTPMKIYSYMNSKTPIVATKIESHTQILNSKNSILVDLNQHSLAQGIGTLLENDDLGNSLALEAKKTIDEKFSFQIFEDKIKKAYQSL